MNLLHTIGLMLIMDHNTEMWAKDAGIRDIKAALRKAEEQRDKFRDQVRDTCRRAENAEARALAFEKQTLDLADARDDLEAKFKRAAADLAAQAEEIAGLKDAAHREGVRYNELASDRDNWRRECLDLRPDAEAMRKKRAADRKRMAGKRNG